jgi:hypothetical protein
VPLAVTEQDANVAAIVISDGKVFIPVIIKVANSHSLGVSVSGIVHRWLKSTVTIPKVYADVIPIIVGYNYVQKTVVINIADSGAARSSATRIIDSRFEGSVTVAN